MRQFLITIEHAFGFQNLKNKRSKLHFFLLRTSKILPRLNVSYFSFQQFEAQNVLILFLTAIYSLKIDFKGLPMFMYAQFLVQERVYTQDTSCSYYSWSILVLKIILK